MCWDGSSPTVCDKRALPLVEAAWYRGEKLRVSRLPALLPALSNLLTMRLASGRSVLLWFGAIVLVGAMPAAAQQLANCKASKQWTLERIGDHWRVTGQVEMDCGNESMSADQADLFTDTNIMIATGNVVFTSGGNRIAADRLEYNTKTKTGVFYNGFGTATLEEQKKRRGGPRAPARASASAPMFGVQEPDVYFYGDKIAKIGPEKYRVTKGGFTTCVQPTPRWRLTSGSVVLNLDHYAVLTNALFRVKGIPVFYFPIFYYPINKEDRATGFLLPLYGSSTIRGTTLSNGFFWAISRSQDATFLYDWFSKTGAGYGTEYRYVAAPGSDGQIRYYKLQEHAAEYANSAGTVTTTPARSSYQINGNLSQKISRTFRGRARVNYFSNITVQQTYNQNVFQATNRQRVINGSVTGVLGSWSVNGAFDHSEFFYGTTQSTLSGGTPRITFQRAEKPLFGSPLYLSITGEGSHLLAERRTSTTTIDQGLSRFDIFPRIRFPFTKWQFLTISTSAAYRETFWSEQRDLKTGRNLPNSINRHYYDLSVQLTGPIFSRIWSHPGSGYAEKLKHSIEPYFNVERVSPIDEFNHYVQLDGTDTVVGRVTRISYGVTNRFFRKPGGGNGRSRELLTASLGQSYYTDQRAATYDLSYQTAYGSAPSHFSPLALLVRSTPTDSITTQFRAEYDTQFHAIRTMTADGTVAFGEWLHATAGWSQRRFIDGLPGFSDPTRLDHYLNSATNWKVWGNRLSGMYNFNYDILRKRYLQQRLSAGYNAQCCGFAVEYQSYNLSGISSSPVPQDHRFNFTITLAGIGTFANIFGAFGGTGGTGQTGARY
jgi:LPS-assembly protein